MQKLQSKQFWIPIPTVLGQNILDQSHWFFLYLEVVLAETSGSHLGECNVKQPSALLCIEGQCQEMIPPGQDMKRKCENACFVIL